MIFVVFLLLGLALGLLLGGRLARVLEIRLNGLWVVVLAAALKLAALLAPPFLRPLTERYGPLLFTLQFLLLLVFLALNWRLPGFSWLALGGALNLLVIAANGGFMPVPAASVAAVDGNAAVTQLNRAGHVGNYVLTGPGTRLYWLADVFLLPGPLQKSLSVGDFIICGGEVIAVMGVLGARRPGRASVVGAAQSER
ncbi:MAG: DUF5317 family protein [Candidatus Dormibacteria bacterium]